MNKIKEDIMKADQEKWKDNIKSKKTLSVYAKYKKEIKEEQYLYDNTDAAKILFRARANVLNLNWRKKYKNEGKYTNCPMCKQKEETLENFLIEYPKLTKIREKLKNVNQRKENKKNTML